LRADHHLASRLHPSFVTLAYSGGYRLLLAHHDNADTELLATIQDEIRLLNAHRGGSNEPTAELIVIDRSGARRQGCSCAADSTRRRTSRPRPDHRTS